jgi:NAD(P)-dependent dehydrogenase (short-subunit alcohol dehydrogenase family)
MGSNDLHDKVIALTGGASGMGYASAVLLASRGAKVSIADIDVAGLERVKADIEGASGVVMTTQCDIRDSAAVKAWIAATVKAWGSLDGVANIGAVIGRQIMKDTVAEIEDEDWDFVMDVNLKGLMYCMLWPHFLFERGIERENGKIEKMKIKN